LQVICTSSIGEKPWDDNILVALETGKFSLSFVSKLNLQYAVALIGYFRVSWDPNLPLDTVFF
jgi:hypothetical protein